LFTGTPPLELLNGLSHGKRPKLSAEKARVNLLKYKMKKTVKRKNTLRRASV
jgi:hypothetical protein